MSGAVRSRGQRALAGGVAVALMVMLAACGIPTNGSPSVISKGSVPYHLLNPTTPTTVPPSVAVPESIFLVSPGQQVVAVTRYVQVPATLTEILGALLDGPTDVESKAGLQTFLSRTDIQVTAAVLDGIATVDFTASPVQVVGPNQTLAIAQVVYTATAQPDVTGVLFEIADQPISVPTASGAQVLGPVDRTSYLPQAPALFP